MPTPIASQPSTLNLMNMIKKNASLARLQEEIKQNASNIEWEKVNWIEFGICSSLNCIPEFADFLIRENYYPKERLQYSDCRLLNIICDDPYGQTFCDTLELIYVLLVHGINVDKLDSKNNTPIANVLKTTSCVEVIDYLLENGANPNAFIYSEDKDSQTYLEYCLSNLFKFAFNRITDERVNINYPIIESLLKRGASLTNPQTQIHAVDFLMSMGKEKTDGPDTFGLYELGIYKKTLSLLGAYKDKENLEKQLPLNPVSPKIRSGQKI